LFLHNSRFSQHLTPLVADFGVSRYAGAYQLGSAGFQPMAGKLFRYFSIKVFAQVCYAPSISVWSLTWATV
jgi:hypothetical protein